MKTKLYARVAAVALTASCSIGAGHLAFTPGEGDFSWDTYNEWAANAPDLTGQDVTVFGPWLSPEDEIFRSMITYFDGSNRRECDLTGSDSFEQQIVIDAEAGSPAEYRCVPAAGSGREPWRRKVF